MRSKLFYSKTVRSTAAAAAIALLSACNPLSDDARKIAGNYYIPEISEDLPLFEFRDDATCTIRKVWPSVLTISVDGTWNVVGDSIVAEIDPSTLSYEGDSTAIGNIATHYSRHIQNFNELTLTLEENGVQYVYHRR